MKIDLLMRLPLTNKHSCLNQHCVPASQTPALMPGCIEEFGVGLHARQTDLKDPTIKGGVSAERDESNKSSVRPSRPLKIILSLGLILAATLIAYSPVLFNFFNGDDFVHLTWLKDAITNQSLIWKNFYSSWLDGTTTRFYRPLISIFMVSDYLIWGVNGLGFRITNLLCHGLSTIFIFLIVSHLLHLKVGADNSTVLSANKWALASAALFALYPLHPEAVSWITGRVDSVVTTFVLASLWSYMRWRTSGRIRWCCVTSGFMILGLLSKEMAITLPFVFLAYELCFKSKYPKLSNIFQQTYITLKPTWLFFGLLGVYFVVRWLALGTFVGGYDDSLFFVQDIKGLLASWVHGLSMTIIPINKDLLGAHHIVTKLWQLTITLCFVLSIWCAIRHSKLLPVYSFVIIWLVLSLVPVYKIFAIADDLQGSRLAYLATAPLCILATSGFAVTSPIKFVRWGIHGLLLSLLILAAALVWSNNQAWAEAGRQSNAIEANLSKLYSKLPGDPQVLIIGLPDHIAGAYVCRNALWGMTKKPQLHRDIVNCLMVNDYEPILPFGFLKESIENSADKIKLFRWAGPKLGLVSVCLPKSSVIAKKWTSSQLRQVLQPLAKTGTQALWRSDGTLELWGGPGFRRRPEVDINFVGQPCWSVNFIAVTAELLGKAGGGSGLGADLLYCNDLTPEFALQHRTHAQINTMPQEQTFIFPLRSLPQWALGGQSHRLKMMLPDNCHLRIKSIELVPTKIIMPQIAFANSGYLGSKGFLHLSSNKTAQAITVDASNVPGASAVLLAITRPNLTFESQNPQQEGLVVDNSIHYGSTVGTIVLKREMFPSTGIYEARLWAVDSQGRTVGVGSDHIVISIDS
ncbi:MAG: hypothetical protein HY711_05315 [Candidatus Melainabacteria bacterium]|nr:hypothetical protein [Candidatus Melainabacteria bacterium]